MRDFSEGFAAHIASGATTLCWCWKLERADGAVLGFTDHDVPLAFGGVNYAPADGLDGSETVQRLGAQTQTSEVLGVLSSAAIAEDEIALGRYDGARIESWRVNWRVIGQRELIRVDTIGEIVREDGVFRAELRSAQHQLNAPRGRLYQHMCDAHLGDGRCGVDLDGAAYRADVTVTGMADARTVVVSELGGFADGWFVDGTAQWISGKRDGVREAILAQAGNRLGFARAVSDWVEIGDTLRVFAGCDKQFATCRTKFGNGANFQGFPHIPGNDFVLRYPSATDRLDGEALVR
ncbi:DUF2163 domain-containing protein [Pelagibacterium luteolum]|uniref:Bacteriophage phiJL001 Gp84 C-terminal domain-containing protein n=1 Tax=Pelagibacterium luteolum TaxID=440168 RepID=A0A1G7TN68_9HYPH|nr:DUF2163 domain-containing protein [Pelagibacterium luteolum]SDG36725.1 phage conserved hypothetical protein BR0599 [Pelagibacterium luteolum]